jgi:WD40 repeat protein
LPIRSAYGVVHLVAARAILLLTLGAALIGLAACAHTPTDQPLLRLEAGMHSARLRRLAVNRAGTRLVSVADDKTARIWNLADGKLIRTIRPPSESGLDGLLWATALAPDGRTVAVAGWIGLNWTEGTSVFLLDADSGRVKGHIDNLPEVVHHVAFSPDGRSLAIGLRGENGVSVYSTDTHHRLWRDDDYDDSVTWLEYDRSGRLVTASADGGIRLYDKQLKRISRQGNLAGKRPCSARFSPQGTRIAVGFADESRLSVIAGADLGPQYQPAIARTGWNPLCAVAWSASGDTLYAGGELQNEQGQALLFSWASEGRGVPSEKAVSGSAIVDIQAPGDGSLVVGTADPAWYRFDDKGVLQLGTESPIVTQTRRNQLLLSADGLTAALVPDPAPTTAGDGVRGFTLRGMRLHSQVVGLSPPRESGLSVKSWRVDDWRNSATPHLGPVELELAGGEQSRSLAIAPDGRSFVLGADFSLRKFSNSGVSQWMKLIPSRALNVNVSADGRWLVAALSDGSIRWYDYRWLGEERMAVFLHPKGTDWVAWVPEGFFDASPEGASLVGYHLNQGPASSAEWIGINQLFDVFFRPDILARALDSDVRSTALAALGQIGDVRKVLASGLPPSVTIVAADSSNGSDEVTLRLRLADRGGGIGKIVYRINGVEIDGRNEVPSVAGSGEVKVKIGVPPGRTEIGVSAFTRSGRIESPASRTILEISPESEVPPSLHVLSVGVTNYRDHRFKLKYANNDAVAIAAAFKKGAKDIFSSVNVVRPLLDWEVTGARLKQEFDALAKRVKPNDVFVFYAAGHGRVRDGQYVFMPWDYRYGATDDNAGALDEKAIQDLLAKIPAQKTLILLDTCSAGAFASARTGAAAPEDYGAAVQRLVRTTGRAVIAAAGADQLAIEGYDNHGVFTLMVMAALGSVSVKGDVLSALKPADTDTDGVLAVDELERFVRESVSKVTGKRQLPVGMLQLRGEAFAVARLP